MRDPSWDGSQLTLCQKIEKQTLLGNIITQIKFKKQKCSTTNYHFMELKLVIISMKLEPWICSLLLMITKSITHFG
jgi:hypothetical protein